MKRILILTYYYPPDLSAGSFRAQAMVKALSDLYGDDLVVDVVTTMPNRYRSHTSKPPPVHEVDGNVAIRRIDLPRPGPSQRSQAIHFTRFAWSVSRLVSGRRYDLVVATSSRLMTAALGAWVARKVRARLVLDIRDIFVETMNDLVQSRIAGMALKIFDLLERWTMNRADKISVVSAGFIPYFEGRYKDPPLEVFTNGIDEIFLQDFARGKGQSGEELQIVYAGNIGDGQSLHRIVPALAKRLEGVAKFRIVGDGGRIKNLKEEVRSVGVTNVEISPPISRSEVLDLYREADILFLHLNDIPAFRRVIPSKLFEYAATGKPIIAGVAGYCAEFVDSEISNAEVFAPCDLESAMKAIDRLRHTASPRSKFIEKYNRKTIMERMARLIHEVATEPRQ